MSKIFDSSINAVRDMTDEEQAKYEIDSARIVIELNDHDVLNGLIAALVEREVLY